MTGSTPCERAVARMVGNRRSQNSRAEVPGVQPHVRVPGLDHPAHDRLGDHVARGQVGELVDALHEPVALEVDEEGALAADRLGDQRLLAAGVGAEVHDRRVELDELQVAQGGAGPQRERHAVAGRDRGVGGLGEHLAEAARGEHDGPAADRADAVADALADHVQGHPGDAAVLGEQQVDGERVLDHLDLGRRARRPRSAPAGSRRRWRRRRRARSGRGGGRPRGSATARRRGCGRSWCRARSARGPPRGLPGRARAPRRGRRRRRRPRGCRPRAARGCPPGPSAAAMPPCAHWVEPAAGRPW